MADKTPRNPVAPKSRKPPSLPRQAWNLAQALADFVADGCRTATEGQYRRRLEICDACDHRRHNRCLKCGCRLSLKARGRAFECPLARWPALNADEEMEGPGIPKADTHSEPAKQAD